MQNGTVLIIDDDDLVRKALRNLLIGRKYRVDVAENANAGLRMVQTGNFDAVLLDLNLPDGNGIDILKEIRVLKPALPVILISGNVTVENEADALEFGAVSCLQKPIPPEILLDALQDAI